ncbi:YceI family protein [Stappia sp. F7233]|uniref:YceI family protein n=1 Tax=Stappia albiluteola TaxID=2758565 RepID=A0A839A9U3_9HYPH|nr:YceI family protein [Stappia albiluteola]MBA5775818.1 YceI family protein [Stappia albiluteola]
MIRFATAALLSALAVSPVLAEPIAYTLDKSHSNLAFSYNHLGYSTTSGRFADWNAELLIDEENPANSTVKMTIDVASLDTFWGERDTHFKSGDFFDVGKNPTASFVSTKVEKVGEKQLAVSGDLTIKGITKPVTLDVVVNTIGEHPLAKVPAVGLNASTVIKRSDFGMDLYVPYVGDEVTVTFSAEALKAQD